MKTAKEWRKSRYFGNNSEDGIETIIKEIQLDAIREGLEKADSIAWSKRDKWDEGDGYSPTKAAAAEEIGRAIRIEAEKISLD